MRAAAVGFASLAINVSACDRSQLWGVPAAAIGLRSQESGLTPAVPRVLRGHLPGGAATVHPYPPLSSPPTPAPNTSLRSGFILSVTILAEGCDARDKFRR